MLMTRGDNLRLNDWFCGAGGATQGAHAVPGITPVLAANHDKLAIETHSTNFPDVEHFRGDIRDLDVARHPYAEIFWASPECTNWSQAKGNPQDYSKVPGLFGDAEIADDVARSRALMQDVIRYLEGMVLRQQPVLAGVVENVTDIRKWTHWEVWRSRIEGLGYKTRLIALNSMHAQSKRTPRAPQSRDRLYLAYWHESLQRDPDWDKWLRPSAWCPTCETEISAIQVWRKPGNDMGRYRSQYDYRCPKVSCRGQIVEPHFVPAAAAIDWSLPGQRIGDRAKPLADKTRARIKAGAKKYARPLIIEAGGNQYDAADPKHRQHGQPGAYMRAWPADSEPLKTLHTALTKGVVVPPFLTQFRDRPRNINPNGEPLRTIVADGANHAMVMPPMLIPVEGRDGKQASDVSAPMRTQTARHETAIMLPPYVTEFRGGGSIGHPTSDPLATVSAGGNNHGLVIPPLVMRNNTGGAEMLTPTTEELRTLTTGGHQSLVNYPGLLVPAGGTWNDTAVPLDQPMRTRTTRETEGLVTWDLNSLTEADWDQIVDASEFRMLAVHEIHAGMAFIPTYIVLGSNRQRVKQLGNAVTPPVAEVLVAALVEVIQGYPVEMGMAA